jgi:hypothetical protein
MRAWAALAALVAVGTGCAWTVQGGGRVAKIVDGPTLVEGTASIAGGVGGKNPDDELDLLTFGFTATAGRDVTDDVTTASQQWGFDLTIGGRGRKVGLGGAVFAGLREYFTTNTPLSAEVGVEFGPAIRLASVDRHGGTAAVVGSLRVMVGGDFGGDGPAGVLVGLRLTIGYVSVDDFNLHF